MSAPPGRRPSASSNSPLGYYGAGGEQGVLDADPVLLARRGSASSSRNSPAPGNRDSSLARRTSPSAGLLQSVTTLAAAKAASNERSASFSSTASGDRPRPTIITSHQASRRGSSSQSSPFLGANLSVFADEQDREVRQGEREASGAGAPSSPLVLSPSVLALADEEAVSSRPASSQGYRPARLPSHSGTQSPFGRGITLGPAQALDPINTTRSASEQLDFGDTERRLSWREEAKLSPVRRRPSWRDDRILLPHEQDADNERWKHQDVFEDDQPSPSSSSMTLRQTLRGSSPLGRHQALPMSNEGSSSGSANAHYHSQSSGRDSPQQGRNTRSSAPASGSNSPGRKAPAARRPIIPTAESMSIRTAPRPRYLAQASRPSKRIEEEEPPKKLLLLDLNGTLLHRTSRTREGSTKPIPRPFLSAFLEYCLGSTDAEQQPSALEGMQHDQFPLGTHFHRPLASTDNMDSRQPRSQGAYEVIVWSSAQPANVDSMLVSALDAEQRSRLLRVWARNTLVPARYYRDRAQTTKDLEIVWHALNLSSDERLYADRRDYIDREQPDEPPAHYEAAHTGLDPHGKPWVGAAARAAEEANKAGPFSERNTLLLDDTLDKARLQPFNHLLITEFGQEQVDAIKAFHKKVKNRGEDSPVFQALHAPLLPAEKSEGEDEITKRQLFLIERHDNLLLQTIGVLENLRWQDNAAAYIKSGALRGYGAAAAGVGDGEEDGEAGEPSEDLKEAEHWIQEGLKALEARGIVTTLAEQLPLVASREQ